MSPIRGAAGCSFAPYDIKNVHVVGIDVVSNRPKATAYRAPGAPIGAYPAECPVSGGCHRADTGNISIFVGGDRETFEKVLPLTTTLGRRNWSSPRT